ncbi:hypothetical protein [Bradyrhizobium sp. UFLA05-112]
MGLKDPDQFMARLRMGYTMRAVTSGKGTPDGKRVRGLGTREGFEAHCREFPEWGRKAAALLKQNADVAQKRKCSKLTHCNRGHLLAGNNLAYKRDSKDGKFYRYCKACHRLRGTWGPEMTPQQEQEVIKAAKAGIIIEAITRGTLQRPKICSFLTLKHRRIANPELDRIIIANARNPLSRRQLMRFQIVPANAAFFSLTEPRPEIPPFELRPGDYEWILSLVGWKFPYDMRLDIAQDVIEALLLRSISREQVPSRIVDFISKHRRAVGNPEYDCDLDSPLTEGGKLTRVDAVAFTRWKVGLG